VIRLLELIQMSYILRLDVACPLQVEHVALSF